MYDPKVCLNVKMQPESSITTAGFTGVYRPVMLPVGFEHVTPVYVLINMWITPNSKQGIATND